MRQDGPAPLCPRGTLDPGSRTDPTSSGPGRGVDPTALSRPLEPIPRMNRPTPYPASRAATVVVALASIGALVLVGAGTLYLRDGSTTGWLMIVMGVVPLGFAIWIRRWIRRGDSPGSREV
jgi:hypothetical protein